MDNTVGMEKQEKDIIGVIHLRPFDEGRTDYDKLAEWLGNQVEEYIAGGLNNIILQDQTPGKSLNLKAATYMAALGRVIKEKYPKLKLGIILDSNNGKEAMFIANAAGADYVRVKVFVGAMLRSGGIIEGNYEDIRLVKPYLDRDIKVYADIYDRMGSPIGDIPIETMAQQAVKFGADKVIITGSDSRDTVKLIGRVKAKIPDTEVLIGGGVNAENIAELLKHASGAIVSSCFISDEDKNKWDREKIKAFMRLVK